MAKGSTAVRNAGGILGVKAGRGAARPMPNDKTLRLRPGYRLDLVGDPRASSSCAGQTVLS